MINYDTLFDDENKDLLAKLEAASAGLLGRLDNKGGIGNTGIEALRTNKSFEETYKERWDALNLGARSGNVDALKSKGGMPQYVNPLLKKEWSTYNIKDLAEKKFVRKEALENGSDFTIFFGEHNQQDPANPSDLYLLKNEFYDKLHNRFIGEIFSYTDKNKNKKYDDKIDKYNGKLLQVYLFISTDGAWLLEMSKKLETVHDNDLVIFLEVTNDKTKDVLSDSVLICIGGRNAAVYYNEPSVAKWYGKYSTIKKETVQELIKSCANAETFKTALRSTVSTMGKIISWAPANAGKLLCYFGEVLEKIKIPESFWNNDTSGDLLKLIDKAEKDINESFGISIPTLSTGGAPFKPFIINLQAETKIFFEALRAFVKLAGRQIEFIVAFVCGIINGIIDLIAGLFIFIGWILKFIGGAIEGAAAFEGDSDYYIALATEYADNFLQALQNLDWGAIFEAIKDGLIHLYESISLKDLFANTNINAREIGYYIGYIAINIAACFVGVGEIAALVGISKPIGAMAVVIDFIAETVGKLPTGLKLTAESIFLVLKKYISLLAQGTKSIIEFINNIFSAILKWILVVTGKIARQAFLLVLASGKRLACSIIPLEEIVILFSRIISARVKSNLGKLGVLILEKEGRYFVRYEEEVIFIGDKDIVEGFIVQTLEKDEIEALQYLKELKVLAKKKVELKLKENIVLLEDFIWVRFKYVKRLTSEKDKLRDIFNNGVRKKFLKEEIGKNLSMIERLRKAGVSDEMVERLIKEGRPPDGWRVHHKYPLDDSGTNNMQNFLLIEDDPLHKAITVYQNSFAQEIKAGDASLVNWPMYHDILYP